MTALPGPHKRGGGDAAFLFLYLSPQANIVLLIIRPICVTTSPCQAHVMSSQPGPSSAAPPDNTEALVPESDVSRCQAAGAFSEPNPGS
jgi:hypothetical protein